jgi:hypothetical protein
MNKDQIIEQFVEHTAADMSRINSDLLCDTYAVWPDNSINARDHYSAEEWDSFLDRDCAMFQEGSRSGIMLSFMLINAGLAPTI